VATTRVEAAMRVSARFSWHLSFRLFQQYRRRADAAALDASVGRIAGLQASRRTGVRAIAGIPVRARNRLQHRPFETVPVWVPSVCSPRRIRSPKGDRAVRHSCPLFRFVSPRARRPIVRSEYHVSIFIGHCNHGSGSLELWYPGGSCALV
jgi:hypothetical protein